MRRLAPICLVLAAGCQPAAAPDDAGPESTARAQAAPAHAPSSQPQQMSRVDPRGLVPAAERGEKGARNVLLSWAAAMENRDFDAARRLFGGDGGMSGMDAREYALTFDYYDDIAIGFGDGRIEGAAGSLYYEAPVWMIAKGSDGPERREGSITLRRVNNVPGASRDELRWHIEKLAW